ncbi:hypothetical protein BHM03_00031625 [Ensete ventricosum]|nr:hypothetical protein BHM03_00031625 [Ensete ventricosum]
MPACRQPHPHLLTVATHKPSPYLFLFHNYCSSATIVVDASHYPVASPALLLNSTNRCLPNPTIASLGSQQPQPQPPLVALHADIAASFASHSAFLYYRLLPLLPMPSSTNCSPCSHIAFVSFMHNIITAASHCLSTSPLTTPYSSPSPCSTTAMPSSLLPSVTSVVDLHYYPLSISITTFPTQILQHPLHHASVDSPPTSVGDRARKD